MLNPGEPIATPTGFFCLRTPLLSFDVFQSWGRSLPAPSPSSSPAQSEELLAKDREALRRFLGDLFRRDEMLEALFLASPHLVEAMDRWWNHPDSPQGSRVEQALVRYFSRMAGRATPFGLFSACSVAEIGGMFRLEVPDAHTCIRHTRLDMEFLVSLLESLASGEATWKHLKYRPNSSLYRTSRDLRYAEARHQARIRSYHLVTVETTDYLESLLELAEAWVTPEELTAALAASQEVSLQEAEDFVRQLVACQILVPESSPNITGAEPIHGLIESLGGRGETAGIAGRLAEVHRMLQDLDGAGLGNKPERYSGIARLVEGLPAEIDPRHLFQVDLMRPAGRTGLGAEVLSELTNGIHTLHRLADEEPESLADFRKAFISRYEGREVRLVEVLDESIGIGFPVRHAASTESPLLAGLTIPTPAEGGARWRPREQTLLELLAGSLSCGEQILVLKEEDLNRLASPHVPPLPAAFCVSASIAAASEEAIDNGDFQILLNSCHGPSGARLLGRFCHADMTLQRWVEQHLREEESREPDAVFAEVVHLPEGRLGNILCRPSLRQYDIEFLGRSGLSREHCLPITDLLVSVSGERVLVRSERLERRIIPRLTTAHNFRRRSLPLYRFLCALQGQATAGSLGWSWGPLQRAPFLPRVTCGRLVLSRARWNLSEKTLRALGACTGGALFRAVQELRETMRWPRIVELADGDNLLPIDLDNVLSVESFVHQVKSRPAAEVIEMFPPPEALCALGPEGRFVHEIVVPFVRAEKKADIPDRASPKPVRTSRRFTPGSDWLYVKLYCGEATADLVLRELVHPLTSSTIESGASDRWFFIRYGDPDPHIRLRLHGERRRLREEVEPRVVQEVERFVREGLVWRVQCDTYEREVERYGGSSGIELAEDIFHHDSEAAIRILELLRGDEGHEDRWRAALLSMDLLFSDLELGLEERLALMSYARQSYGREFKTTRQVDIRLGERFRKDRRSIEAFLDPRPAEGTVAEACRKILLRRSSAIATSAGELRSLSVRGGLTRPLPHIAQVLVHMLVNRLLRSAHRAQELVLYDFLIRVYESRAARERAVASRSSRQVAVLEPAD